jgi:hypothetical protein
MRAILEIRNYPIMLHQSDAATSHDLKSPRSQFMSAPRFANVDGSAPTTSILPLNYFSFALLLGIFLFAIQGESTIQYELVRNGACQRHRI